MGIQIGYFSIYPQMSWQIDNDIETIFDIWSDLMLKFINLKSTPFRLGLGWRQIKKSKKAKGVLFKLMNLSIKSDQMSKIVSISLSICHDIWGYIEKYPICIPIFFTTIFLIVRIIRGGGFCNAGANVIFYSKLTDLL